jgi:SsrA-binding protein
MPVEQEEGGRTIATNRKARYDYAVLDTVEAGIVLTGTEVKSLRQGRANLVDSYAMVRRGEVWLIGMHISPYDQGSYNNVDPTRDRKILLHRKEIRKLVARAAEKGLTLVPLRLYFTTKNIAKVLIGVCRGKREYDRREDIAAREAERDIRRRYAR